MTQPSQRSRELVRGAFDLHVHIDPDVVGRIVDDVTLAERFAERGLAGFALKSHYTSTAERARVVNRVSDGVQAIGSIALNAAVGGLNALALEIAAREGARIVWLPTVDAVNEASARDRDYPPGAKVPMWVRLQRELRDAGMEAPPVPVVDGHGNPLPALLDVIAVAAKHRLVLATGHLSRDEIFTVVEAALAGGVRDVVVTHPEFTSQDLSIADQVALAERGAVLERCFTTPFTGKCTWERVVDGIRATGVERNLLSTDLGQPANPPVEDGLPLFADRLLDAAFTLQEVQTMTVVNSRRLAGAEAR
jgi:stage V sporulation protein SpoVS